MAARVSPGHRSCCSSRLSCTPPSGSSACTRAVTCAASTPIAERLQGMHDAAHVAKGGKKASQPRSLPGTCLTATTAATPRPSRFRSTIRRRACRGSAAPICEQCGKPYEPQRSSSRFCSPACRQRAHHKRLSVTLSVTPAPAHRPRKCFATSGTPMSRGSRRKAGSRCLHSMARTTVSTRC